jgi:hypothetical protein
LQATPSRLSGSIRRHKTALACCLAFVLAIALLATINFRAKDLITGNQPWTVTGAFKIGGAWAFTKFDPQMSSREKRLDFWGSWSGSQANVGELHSPAFIAPRILECFLSGYPGKPGLELYLERQSDHLRIPLNVPGNSFPGEVWRRFHWSIPSAVRNQPVMLVAIDNSPDSWMGVSTPRSFSYLAVLHQELPSNLFLLAHFLLNFSLFLLPGFGLASYLSVKRAAALRYPLIIIVITGAFLGYLSFYAFFFSRPAGKLLVLVIYLTSLTLIGLALSSKVGLGGLVKKVAEPLAIAAMAGLCYLSFAFLFINPMVTGAGNLEGRFFNHQMPGDNRIPLFFAQRIYDRTPLRPFCCGDWLSSDRPPLQTGIFLMERPLPLTRNIELNYQLLATALQCLWICGVWCVLSSLGTSVVQIRRALTFLIFSGLIFYDSVYTWPKFLTGALVLFAISILIDLVRSRRVATYSDTIIASACIGLALVSHPGAMFSLVTIPIFLLWFRAMFPVRKLALVLPLLLLFVLPWTAFQKFVDPPGNRLAKWHLAGVIPIDSDTPLQAIRKAYSSRPFSEILAFRWANIKTLGGEKSFFRLGLPDLASGNPGMIGEQSRAAQEKFLWNALGPLNLGWFAGLFLLVKAAMGKRRANPKIPYDAWIIAVIAVNLLLWCLIEFGPSFTIIATLSFADLLMLSIGLVGFILELPNILIFGILAIQLLNFFVIWVWSPPYAFNVWAGTNYTVSLQYPLLVFGALFSLLLLGHLCRSFLPDKPPNLPSSQ